MPVSKEELLARYKELKAQGVDITLMALKKQMEEEVSGGFSSGGETYPEQQPSPVNNPAPAQIKYNNPGQQTTGFVQSSHTCEQSGINFQQPDYAKEYMKGFITTFAPCALNPGKTIVQTTPVTRDVQPLAPKQPTEVYHGNVDINATPSGNTVAPAGNKYCLIGYPLGHSLSSYIHEAGFKSMGLEGTYEIIETPPDNLVETVKRLKYGGYSGFNVTIPLKIPITLFLDEIDPSADVIGAVNTVKINPDKTMKGYNTDVIGFRRAIPNNFILKGRTAGVLGTGGAARAAITALASEQVRQIKIYTRNVPNAIELLNFLRSKFPNTEFEAFQIERIRDLSDISILVNTTPVGMQGRSADMTPVEERELSTLPPWALVYDVIYNPKKTLLLKLAQKHGYQTINGMDMFIYQALEAQKIWTGRVPDFKDMKIAALENL